MTPGMREILEHAACGTIRPNEAVKRLVGLGVPKLEAREFVLIALGGSDIIETAPDGRQYFISDAGRILKGRDGWPVRVKPGQKLRTSAD